MATTADLKRNPESIGKAIQGVQIKIADSTGQPLENGNIGFYGANVLGQLHQINGYSAVI